MDIGIDLAAYDFVVIGIFAVFLARGVWLGFLKQVTGLVALYSGYLVASQYHDRLFPFLRDISNNPKVVFLITYIALFIAAFLIVMLIGKGLEKVVEITITKWFDRLLGAVVGLAKALILVVIMHMLVETALAPENTMLKNCFTCPYVNVVTDLGRKIIRDPELREALKQKAPAISLDKAVEILAPEIVDENQDDSKPVDTGIKK